MKGLHSFSLLFMLVFVSVGCATSPTGRSQLVMLPDAQLDSMGAQSFQEMKGQTPTETDPRINAYVKCVANLITKANEDSLGQRNWEVVVFKSDQVNAFALPGGKIGVYTGLLKVAKNSAQLAAVIGHEVGHVLARHGNERVSQGLIAQGGLALAQGALSDNKYKGLILAGLGLGTQFGILLPFGRTQESEADEIGLKFMAKAGFNPYESVSLWKNMTDANGANPPQWMSTHPSNSTRIHNLEARIPSVLSTYNQSPYRNQAASCNP